MCNPAAGLELHNWTNMKNNMFEHIKQVVRVKLIYYPKDICVRENLHIFPLTAEEVDNPSALIIKQDKHFSALNRKR